MSKSELNNPLELSVIVPVVSRVDDLEALFAGYDSALASLGLRYEVLFVVDGGNDDAYEQLLGMKNKGAEFTILRMAKYFGESTVLSAGFDRAKGELVLTLPAYFQIEPGSIKTMFDAIPHNDLVIGHRWPRAGGAFERIRRRTFHFLLRSLSGEEYRDLGCAVRLFRHALIDEINLYGDQHRFFPVLASRQGFRVAEVDVQQSPRDEFRGKYRLREYLHRLLDIVTIFFLVRFTKKPLRFFGMVGSVVFAVGGLVVLTLVIQRLFFDVGLADRPALLLGSLFLVLGVQIFALGLVGELIIFTHAGSMKEYTIAEIAPATNDVEESRKAKVK
ncbi:MAG TPA: glycosyltransferase [Woeseiaceae bacterium]|nr:glycosyltransferase [Woeseiaceae bacterium]